LGDPRTRHAIVIDRVFEQHLRDVALLRELELKLVVVVDTHCHADHVTGAWMMQQATGCHIAISRRSQPPIQGVDLPLVHGDRIPFGSRHLEVRATPGHTDGCITLVLDDKSMAFTGDTLLIRGAGRCDFQQGSAHALYRSIIQEIFTLPEACLLFPAHDYSGRTVSSVAEERTHNPRIGGGADEGDFVGFMANLNLPHPRQIDIALPANLRSGRPADGKVPHPADWGPVRQTYAGLLEIEPEWVAEHLQQVHVLDVRQPQEMQDSLGRIAGSQLIPLNELKARVSEVPREKPLVAAWAAQKARKRALLVPACRRQHGHHSICSSAFAQAENPPRPSVCGRSPVPTWHVRTTGLGHMAATAIGPSVSRSPRGTEIETPGCPVERSKGGGACRRQAPEDMSGTGLPGVSIAPRPKPAKPRSADHQFTSLDRQALAPAPRDHAIVRSISRRKRTAGCAWSMSTSSQRTAWPAATARFSFTLCARPSGRPPTRIDSAAGSSLP